MSRRLAAGIAAFLLAFTPAGVRFALAGTNGVAVADAYEVNEDQQLVVAAPGVLANDQPEGAKCVTMSDDAGLAGSIGLGVGADGHFTYTPPENFRGGTSFDYTMGMDQGGCPSGATSVGTVTITVHAVNDPPTVELASTCDGDVSVTEDSGPFSDPGHCVEMVDFGPSDENNQGFNEWVVVSDHAELFSAQPSISPVDGTFGALAFTPAPNAHGTAEVRVRGRDSGGTDRGGDDLSTRVTFNITITAANDAPTANADSFTALPGRTLNVKEPGVLSNDSDIDGDSLTASKVSNPAHGVVTLAADGAFSYTPTAGYLGLDAFSYRASDGSEFSATRTVTLNVTAIPTPVPTIAPPSAAPSSAPSVEVSAAPSPSGSAEPSASIDPLASPSDSAGPSAGASLEPGASPVPVPAGESGRLSIPVLVVGLLLLSLLAFGAAMYVPKWLERRRAGASLDEG